MGCGTRRRKSYLRDFRGEYIEMLYQLQAHVNVLGQRALAEPTVTPPPSGNRCELRMHGPPCSE